MTPLGSLFGMGSALASTVLGQKYAHLLLYSTEKGIMVTITTPPPSIEIEIAYIG